MIPHPLTLAVLALAAWRCWRLAALDTLPSLVWLRTRLVGAHHVTGGMRYDRPLVEEWLSCPFCAGLWSAFGWYGAWLLWPHGCLYGAVPLALSALVGIVQTALPD